MNILHDVLKARIDLLARPIQTHGVLCEFEPRHCNAAGISGLAGHNPDTAFAQRLDRIKRARHVGAFDYELTAILNKGGGVFGFDLVLRGAGKHNVTGEAPRAFALVELAAELLRIVSQTPPGKLPYPRTRPRP